MTSYIALLRAINLAGKRMVSMAALRDIVSGAGFTNVRTLLQSGNLVFQGDRKTTATIELMLERAIAAKLGLQTNVLVRTPKEWTAIMEQNPFPKEAERDPGHLLVMFLKAAPNGEAVRALRAVIVGREIVHSSGREAYIVYPDGVGRSRLTNALIEKKLGTRGTARNWNTVVKLARLMVE